MCFFPSFKPNFSTENDVGNVHPGLIKSGWSIQGNQVTRFFPANSDTKMVPQITLWWTNIAMKNGHRNSGFSHEKLWFSIAMLVHQRVPQIKQSRGVLCRWHGPVLPLLPSRRYVYAGFKPCGESRGHILPRNPPTVARIMGWLIIPFAIDITWYKPTKPGYFFNDKPTISWL